MAKKLNEIFVAYNETQYATIMTSVVTAALANNSVMFSPIFKQNGVSGTAPEYNIQRLARNKAKKVANANSKSTKDALALLDSFGEQDWVTLPAVTGELRSIGIKFHKNDKFDFDNVTDVQARMLAADIKLQAVERAERLITEMYDNATDGGALPKFVAGETKVTDAISDIVNKIMLLSDDYKTGTDMNGIVIGVNPLVSRILSRELKDGYTEKTLIAGTDIMSNFSIDGIPVVVDATLNKFEDTDATKRLGAIIYDTEALAFSAEDKTAIDQTLGITRYVGNTYYDVIKLVDKDRTYKVSFDATGKAAKTAKASD